MTIVPQCMSCQNFLAARSGSEHVMVCKAFPIAPGIPQAILLARHDHRNPYPGDHGIRFESKSSR